MKLIGIIRVSSAAQAKGDKAGKARQQAAIEAIAKAQQGDLTVFEIDDVSGSNLGQTPEWQDEIVPRLLAGAHLAVDHIDRIARVDRFDFRVFADVQRVGARIYTPTGVQDLNDPSNALVAGILALIGGAEKREIQRRMAGAKEAKRRRGEHVTGPHNLPMGVGYRKDERRWFYTDDAWKVREAFRLVVEEGVTGLSELGRQYGTTGWTVKSWLENPIYKGIRRYDKERKGEAYKRAGGRQAERRKTPRPTDKVFEVRVFDPAEQLVSDETWAAAQAALAARRGVNKARKASTLEACPYTGFVTSGEASRVPTSPTGGAVEFGIGNENPEHVVYGRSYGERRFTTHPQRYVCACKEDDRLDRCNLKQIRAVVVNAALDRAFEILGSQPWFLEAVENAVDDTDRQRKDLADQIRRLEQAIQGLDAGLDRLLDLYVRGSLNQGRYESKVAEIEADKAEALKRKMAATDALLGLDAHGGMGKRAAEHLADGVSAFRSDWSAVEKRRWLKKYIQRITLDNSGIRAIVFRLPPRPGSEAMPSWVMTRPFPWAEVIGADGVDRRAAMRVAGYFTAGQLADAIGQKGGADRVRYLMSRGLLPEPAKRQGRKHLWKEAQVEEARRMVEEAVRSGGLRSQ